jgi:hypothetical protein
VLKEQLLTTPLLLPLGVVELLLLLLLLLLVI